MLVIVSYDVSTITPAGRVRLRRVAKTCQDFGQRVQLSVFELQVDPARWTMIRHRLLELIDPDVDSLRFYHMGSKWPGKIEHIGAKQVLDRQGPLVL